MKRNILFFLINIVIIVFLICCMVPNFVYAEDMGLGNLNEYKGSNPNPENVTKRVEKILGIIQIIGTIISIVMLMCIGIKYMLGSVEEKAEYKETLIPYIIGAFLLFSGTVVPNILYKISQNF